MSVTTTRTRVAQGGHWDATKSALTVVVAITSAIASAQEATLNFSPEDIPPPSPPILDCATDYQKRGRPTEIPVDPRAVADLRTALNIDLKASTGGLDELQASEPLCFYIVPDGQLLMRDGRGLEYYFHKVPKWELERVDIVSGSH